MDKIISFSDCVQLVEMLQGKGFDITDISDWKEWESNKLKSIGIRRYDPRKGTVKNLSKIVNVSKIVVTIDTALAHLCSAMGKRCTVLLPKYFDERWWDLTQKGMSYSENCRFIIQTRYGNWSNVIIELMDYNDQTIDSRRLSLMESI